MPHWDAEKVSSVAFKNINPECHLLSKIGFLIARNTDIKLVSTRKTKTASALGVLGGFCVCVWGEGRFFLSQA